MDQLMFRQKFLPLIMLLLNSNLFSLEIRPLADETRFGFASIEVLAIDDSGSWIHLRNIVIRISDKKHSVRSYGLSNEMGLVVMPLPPGKYCYDAFSSTGEVLQTRRKGSEKCFSILKSKAEAVNITILSK